MEKFKTENGTLQSMTYVDTKVSGDGFNLVGNRTMTDGKVSRFTGRVLDENSVHVGEFNYAIPVGDSVNDPYGAGRQEIAASSNLNDVKAVDVISLLLSAIEVFNAETNEK